MDQTQALRLLELNFSRFGDNVAEKILGPEFHNVKYAAQHQKLKYMDRWAGTEPDGEDLSDEIWADV